MTWFILRMSTDSLHVCWRPSYKAIVAFKSTKKHTVNHQRAFCFCCPFPKSNKNLKHKFFIIFFPRSAHHPPLFGLPFHRHDKRTGHTTTTPSWPSAWNERTWLHERVAAWRYYAQRRRHWPRVPSGGFQGKVGATKTGAKDRRSFQKWLCLQMDGWKLADYSNYTCDTFKTIKFTSRMGDFYGGNHYAATARWCKCLPIHLKPGQRQTNWPPTWPFHVWAFKGFE